MKIWGTAALLISAAFFFTPAGAEIVRVNYAQLLVNDLLRQNPDLAAAAVHTVAPGETESKIIASNHDDIGQKSDGELIALKSDAPTVRPASDQHRCTVLLPLLDENEHRVGTLQLGFKFSDGARLASFAEKAAALRNRLQLVLPTHAVLFDPYTLGWFATDTLAQRLTMQALARHPDMNVIAMHVTPPGEKINKVIAINRPNFLGRDSDEVDTDTEKTGRIVMQVIPKTHRMEVHMPMLAADGNIVGTICTVGLWFDENQTADFYARSLAMRNELRAQILSRAALFKP